MLFFCHFALLDEMTISYFKLCSAKIFFLVHYAIELFFKKFYQELISQGYSAVLAEINDTFGLCFQIFSNFSIVVYYVSGGNWLNH